MADEYDRFEREDGGGSFLMGLLAGTVLGAGLGMLFAPKAGSELRNQIGEQAGRIRSQATDGYQQASGKVSQIVDRGREGVFLDLEAQHVGLEVGDLLTETAVLSGELSDDARVGAAHVAEERLGHGWVLRWMKEGAAHPRQAGSQPVEMGVLVFKSPTGTGVGQSRRIAPVACEP